MVADHRGVTYWPCRQRRPLAGRIPARDPSIPGGAADVTACAVSCVPRDGVYAEDAEESMLEAIADGRTDLVFDHVAQGHAATATDSNGVPLIRWCAYYGDVSAMRFLLANGESLGSLGDNLDLFG